MDTIVPSAPPAPPRGLAGWMRRALEECDRTARGADADAVHDLRVALRRCRSMADAVERVDPTGDWRALRRTAKPLFSGLGGLRDVHVMLEWLGRLLPDGEPAPPGLLAELRAREDRLRAQATDALEAFDRKKWKSLARRLPKRLARLRPDGPVFETIAVERWSEAHELHHRALSSRSRIGWHRLRIGIKRFRYVVENFLPTRHAAWGDDLRRMQDLLGEVHDLDVLWSEILHLRPPVDARERDTLRERIRLERAARLAEYRALATGRASIWDVFRAGLPDGQGLRAASLQRLSAWAAFLDPGAEHTRHVRRLALDLAQGLYASGLGEVWGDAEALLVLEAAALLEGVGRARRERGYHKASLSMIRDLPPPPGWSAVEMLEAAVVARYHRGAEPAARHAGYRDLEDHRQRRVVQLAAVLRLANALDPGPEARVLRVDVEPHEDVVYLRAPGYEDDAESAARVARAKHLLESVVGSSFVVRSVPGRPRLVLVPRRPPLR